MQEKHDDNNNSESLPTISERRIFIHKPSDFIKNKYTFLGNLSNNKELLSMDSRKTYHSHKFNMKDFKKQMRQGNEILGSIIRDDTNNLPNLIKNHKINLNNRDLAAKNTYNNSMYSNNTRNTKNNYRANNNRNAKTFNNSNDLMSYNRYNGNEGLRMINQKSEKLVNLNFLVSSPKNQKNNHNADINKNFYQLHGSVGNKNLRQTGYGNQKFHTNRNYYSMDASPRMSNPNLYN